MAKFFVTTPIFYPNARPHLGNVYPTVLSDILARYHRARGDETHFLTGTDENTQKMVDAAVKEGKKPLQFLDETVASFQKTFADLDISYDQYIRTTDQKLHWPGAIELWNKFVASGDIYKHEYEGLYCVGHEAFLTEKDLIDGKCPEHGTKPEQLKEENYFFRLSMYGPIIREKIESDELRIVPVERKNEILSLLNAGLEDISFSRPRRDDWPDGLGVPVPGDPAHVMYVWCDALANYITAIGYGRDDMSFSSWWPADVHIIGKDLLRFHAAIWPAMLMSAGIELPKSILAHGLILSGGKKMSKTLGNVVDPVALLETYGSDAVRYYLARHISPFSDGDLTLESFKDAYNGNLANGLGNFTARVMKLSEDNFSEPVATEKESSQEAPVGAFLDRYEFHRAMDAIWERIGRDDALMATEKPYEGIKSNDAEVKEKARSTLKKLVQELFAIAHDLEPFMPQTSRKILDAIRENKKPETLFPRIG